MLTITFKNVNHGDTIILEWQNDQGEDEIGILDCHLKDGEKNMVIDHIVKKGYKKIHFMILSHPHTDHFSGFPSLIEFCKIENIKIERFWHTAIFDKKLIKEWLYKKIDADKFVNSFLNLKGDRDLLKRLYRQIIDLEEGEILDEIGYANNTSMLHLNKGLWLECFSPSNDELKKYCKKTFDINSEKTLEVMQDVVNPNANLFSSFIRIFTNDWYVLLSADSLKSTIVRINKKCKKRLKNKLIASQVPHHGSYHCHFEDFWLNIPERKEVPVFISAGSLYGLPSKEVVEFFDKEYKEVHVTNFAGGFEEYCKQKFKPRETESQRLSSPFHLYESQFLNSEILPEYNEVASKCGEKKIIIKEDGDFKVDTQTLT